MQLKVKNLNFSYDSVTALENVTFEAQPGEILGVIGPNGSGKTTLLKCLNKVLAPEPGSVLVNEADVIELSRNAIAKIFGVVPQISKTFPFQVLDIIMMGRFPHIEGMDREKPTDFKAVKKAMTLTGISHLSERYIDELSGGERQKVIIARALAQEPQILLLDEPTTHLDINHQLELLNLIKQITQENQLITVLVSHNLNMAARYCDTLLLLSSGKVHSIGNVNEVLKPETIQEVFHVQTELLYNQQIQSFQIISLKPV